MTAYCPTRRSNPLPLLLLSFVVAAALVFAVNLSYHAIITHGDEAVQVKNCIENGGTIQTWHTSDKKITVCLIEGTRSKGKFGLLFEKIVCNGNPECMTAFTKGDSLWKVTDYLKRMGAEYGEPR